MKQYATLLVGLTLSVVASAALAEERVTAISVSTLGVASSSAVELSRALPTYPVGARRNGNHFGRVLLGYNVTSDGTVRDIEVLSAYPVQVYTRTAVNAVKSWRFVPGTADRRMVEFTFMCD